MSFMRAFCLEYEQAEREREEERAAAWDAMTPEEREARVRQVDKGLSEFLERAISRHYIPSAEKAAVYRKAAETAYRLAETEHYDISISEDEQTGTIQLRAFAFCFSHRKSRPQEAKERILDLMGMANEVIIQTEDGFVLLDFDFALCDVEETANSG